MSQADEKNTNPASVTRRGLLLKETREGKGYSIETVHELTKIPLDVLHAIEEGYTVRMVSAYYFKGFIKMYAKFLGIDPNLVLDEPIAVRTPKDVEQVSVVHDEQHTKFNEYISRQNKKQTIIGAAGLGIAVVLLIIGWNVFAHHSTNSGDPSRRRVRDVKVERKVPPRAPVEKKKVEKPKAKQEEKTVVPAVATEDVKSSASSPVAAPSAVSTEAKSKDKKVSLTIRARATGWLQVKVDGSVVFQSTMREGAAESWQAQKSIELSGKNINNLDFEVNGKMLGQLGRSDRGARRVVITQEGLSVNK